MTVLTFDKSTGKAVSVSSAGDSYETADRVAVKLTPDQQAGFEAARKELREAGRSEFDVEIVDGKVQARPDPRPYFRLEVSDSLVVRGNPVMVTFTRLEDAKGQVVVEAFGELWLAPGEYEWVPERTGRYAAYSTNDVRLEAPVEITVARG